MKGLVAGGGAPQGLPAPCLQCCVMCVCMVGSAGLRRAPLSHTLSPPCAVSTCPADIQIADSRAVAHFMLPQPWDLLMKDVLFKQPTFIAN